MPLRRHAYKMSSGWFSRLVAAVVTAMACPFVGQLLADSSTIEGFTEPYRHIEVAAAESGVITALHVREGDVVTQGQLLATLDLEILEATRKVAEACKQAQGGVQAATARLELKQNRLTRLRELLADGHANPEEVATAQKEVQIATAEVSIAKEDRLIKAHEYARIEAQIERRHIRSPINGVITEIHKEVAEYVASTDPNVITIVQCERLRAFFPVPAAAIEKLSTNQKVQLIFADERSKADGLIEFISPVINPESKSVQVKVLLDNARGLYRSGMSCSLVLPTGTQPVAANELSKLPR